MEWYSKILIVSHMFSTDIPLWYCMFSLTYTDHAGKFRLLSVYTAKLHQGKFWQLRFKTSSPGSNAWFTTLPNSSQVRVVSVPRLFPRATSRVFCYITALQLEGVRTRPSKPCDSSSLLGSGLYLWHPITTSLYRSCSWHGSDVKTKVLAGDIHYRCTCLNQNGPGRFARTPDRFPSKHWSHLRRNNVSFFGGMLFIVSSSL